MDPWLTQRPQEVVECEREPIVVTTDLEDPTLTTSGTAKDPTCISASFSDNFQPFEKLPDSEKYLATLETKLEKIQNIEGTSKSILQSLEQAKDSCMVKLLSNTVSSSVEEESFEELKVNPLLKKLVPDRQAVTKEELIHLVLCDYLDRKLITESEDTSDEEKIESQKLPESIPPEENLQ